MNQDDLTSVTTEMLALANTLAGKHDPELIVNALLCLTAQYTAFFVFTESPSKSHLEKAKSWYHQYTLNIFDETLTDQYKRLH